MTTITEEVGRLVPQTEEGALLRGLLLGVTLGAIVAGLLILTHTLRERRAARREERRRPASDPTTGTSPSPL